MAVVVVPSSLRRFTDQQARLAVAGPTISALLNNLVDAKPDMRNHLFASGQLRHFVVVSKNGQDIRLLQGMETPVADGDEVRILASIAGG